LRLCDGRRTRLVKKFEKYANCPFDGDAAWRMPAKAGSSGFAHRFAHDQDEAIVETSHERIVGGYRSAGELASDQRLKARERQVEVVGALDDDGANDIEAAE
jgi:hypothetical protein